MPERYYSIKSLAALLDVAPNTIRKLVEVGHLPAPLQVLGRMPRWSESQIEAYQLALKHGLLPAPPEGVKKKRGSTGVQGSS